MMADELLIYMTLYRQRRDDKQIRPSAEGRGGIFEASNVNYSKLSPLPSLGHVYY
jgi:hypothetical protein